MSPVRLFFFLFILCGTTLFASERSASSDANLGKVIIVLDDIGYNLSEVDALSLPVEVAFSVLPQTPHGKLFAKLAHEQGRDVMLHLPMSSNRNANQGPGGLTVNMYKEDIERKVSDALVNIPYVIGVNNHMGSYLTAQSDTMSDLMHALKQRSLFFLDSRTSASSIAYETAKEVGIPTDKRHVFLDHQQSVEFYEKQLARLIRIAKKHGRAIGIAHPYPSSVAYLAEALKNIEDEGVMLYSVSDYFSSLPTNEKSLALDLEVATAPE
ncbi:divergent polysaccharide deacetylase family protein [Alteromonas sp. 5E99-2]|uniref:divergent polysaccharide deacetylase family protein n=1 Tax=Alteromonas sp. 5E99-2 TaxID=2817683 RepID=UPI001A99F784|nr:divergent polysaccharide deacetylase family protein [Alteromonas sp. 5E99-2]MBO1254609.1 divergent polysaccharide deacetylase family protein [Alteromonas sp. 5E99-2]